ncbi:unnamed protein product [Phytophthora fragariaefolia]|uniref:Unnamed protein product n=1 Tax=Phytophthora fragariaefolia TaxID=1490495 RepID=A0A9W7D044_9STRA|nr:unnamed protein product [Phytophthora fragariaefolia]
MGDAKHAQFNALADVFGCDSPFRYLMCFFHVVVKLVERTRRLPSDLASLVTADVYDLHFSSDDEFKERKLAILTRWGLTSGLEDFTAYFKAQWLTGKFSAWQCFRSPIGFAKTNNPVEQFNRVIKQRYTQRRRLKMGMLFQRLVDCCKSHSVTSKAFNDTGGGNSRFKTRATEMRRKGLLVEVPQSRASISFLVGSDPVDVVNVRADQPPRVMMPSRGQTVEAVAVVAQLLYHTGRIEIDGQPATGWQVDLTAKTCPCRFFFKYGECVHLIFARWPRKLPLGLEDDSFVSRRTARSH